MSKLPTILVILIAFCCFTLGHGSHSDKQNVDQGEQDWATQHMIEEHHISGFDARSFFLLHDYDGSGAWTPEEVRRTYGLDDESLAGRVTEERKQQVIQEVFGIFDPLKTGIISMNDWLRLSEAGMKLPDFGLGPGHHGDMEYEYEIHHFEKHHGENAKEEDLNHPEDIEHFRRHEQEEEAQYVLEKLEQMSIVEVNIPKKFLKSAAS